MTLQSLRRLPHPHGVRFACIVYGAVTFAYHPALRQRDSLERSSTHELMEQASN